MNRMQFMQRLSKLLEDLPDEERFDALKYYNNYFDDAGEENEAQIIAELGSPEAVAAVIKGEPESGNMNTDSHTYVTGTPDSTYHVNGSADSVHYANSEYGAENVHYANSAYGADNAHPANGTYGAYDTAHANSANDTAQANNADATNGTVKKRWSTGAKVCIVILCVLASPMIIALAGAALGIAIAIVAVAFSIIVTIFAVFVSVSSVGVGCTIGGLGMFGIGIYRCVTNVANGLMIGGIGFVITAVGILACIVAWLAWVKATPAICRWIGRCCKRLFTRRKCV